MSFQTTARTVDGENLLIVARDSLDEMSVEAISPPVRHWLRWAADFVRQHEDFWLANRSVGPRQTVIWLLLLKLGDVFQRVHVERVTCQFCGRLSQIANPTDPDLYSGLREMKSALDHAWSIPEVACPWCAHRLPRRAIWAAKSE